MSIIDTVKDAVSNMLHTNYSAEELSKETVPQLKARAKALGIADFEGMKKAALIDAICAGNQPESGDQPKEKSSPVKSDYASHPKFAKFKPIQGAE